VQWLPHWVRVSVEWVGVLSHPTLVFKADKVPLSTGLSRNQKNLGPGCTAVGQREPGPEAYPTLSLVSGKSWERPFGSALHVGRCDGVFAASPTEPRVR